MPDIQRIAFHGQQISTCRDERNGKVYCLPREIASQIGMNWAGQYTKLTRSTLYKQHTRLDDIQTPGGGGRQSTLLLDIDYLPIWLSSISGEKVQESIRATLHTYQEECAKALRDYWFTGTATNPRTVATPSPLDHYPELKAITELALGLAEARDEAAAARLEAQEANSVAARAESKADMALAEAHRMTIEEFIVINGLIRQFPHSKHAEYSRWLGDFCFRYGEKVRKAPVLGKSWDHENAYPVQALAAWLRYEQKRPRQIALVRTPVGDHA